MGLVASAFTNETAIKVVVIPAGSFDMGSPTSEAERFSSEGPQHKVQISKFEMGIYPITQEQYQRVMGTNPSYFFANGGGKDKLKGLDTRRFPVENLSWFDGVEFCIKAREMDGLSPFYRMTDIVRDRGSIKSAKVTIVGGNGWRLPTEAEREYATGAGTTTTQKAYDKWKLVNFFPDFCRPNISQRQRIQFGVDTG